MDSKQSLENFRDLDLVCDKFERGWRHGTSQPVLERYLAKAPQSADARAHWFEELLWLELHYRTQSGETVSPEHYVQRFPEHAAIVRKVLSQLDAVPAEVQAGPQSIDAGKTVLSDTPGQPFPADNTSAPTKAERPHGGSRNSVNEKSPHHQGRPAAEASSTRLSDTSSLQRGTTPRPLRVAGAGSVDDNPTIIIDSALAKRFKEDIQRPCIPDYEILDLIGRGGMGVVFKARQKSLNRIVAVKMILSGHLASPEEIRRFRGEAQAAAALRHPNIVAIHEVREHAGHHYFAMDYVEGCSLQERIQRRPMPPDQAAACVEQIARAIDYAHGQGILHRDLKPANVLLDASGTPLVTDFGLAKRMFDDLSLTATDQFLGTLCYAPPEQVTGKKEQVGPTADIYALGAILYELLTGRPPFKAATLPDTLDQMLHQPAAPPRLLNGKVPKDLETICLKCLAKQPSDRYPAAKELADDLARYARGEPVKARRLGPWGKFWRWCKRKPGVAALLLMLLVAAAAVTLAVIQATQASQAEQRRELTTRFETNLDSVRFDEAYLEQMETLLQAWHQLAPQEAAARRERFYRQFAEAIRGGIYRERLDEADAAALRRAIDALLARPGTPAKLGEALQQELAARLSRPESLFSLAAPFENLDSVFGAQHRVQHRGEHLVIDSGDWPATKASMVVKTEHRCDGNVELLAVFDNGWQTKPRLGLILGSDGRDGIVRGYEFVVRNASLTAPRGAAQPDWLAEDMPLKDTTAELAREWYWLEIYFDGALLQRRRVERRHMPRGTLTLRVSRRNYQLAFQVDQLPELPFQETFPPTSLGVFAVNWPREQGLVSLEAKRVGAPPRASPLQRGDELFNQQAYQRALSFFEQQALISPDAAVRQEADYKRALCHRRLQQEGRAEEILQQLMREPGKQRWPFMAACEAWAMLLEQGRMDEAETVYELVEARFSFAELAVNVPGPIRQRILDTYAIHLNPLDVFRPNPNRIRDALRVQQLIRLFNPEVAEADEKFILMGVYRYDGDLESARQIAEELANWGQATDSPLLDLYAYAWCRLLRLTGQPDRALELLNNRFADARFHHWQRLERARTLIALGDDAGAEADLRDLVHDPGVGGPGQSFIPASLALGGVLRRQHRVEEAHEVWRRALAIIRRKQAPGAYHMLCAHIIGSQLGDWTETDNRRFFNAVLPGRSAGSLLTTLRDRLIDTPAALPAMQDLWRLRVAQPWLERFVFDQVPMPHRIWVPFQLLGVSYLKHTAFGGAVSAEQEHALWQLAQQIVQETVKQGYDNPRLLAQISPYLSSWLIGLPASPLVVDQLPEEVRCGMGYVLAHRFLRRGNLDAAKQLLGYAAQLAGAESQLKSLAEQDLDLVTQNEGLLVVPDGSAVQGSMLIVRQGTQMVCELPISGAVQHRLKVGSYEAEIRRPGESAATRYQVQLHLAGRHTIGQHH